MGSKHGRFEMVYPSGDRYRGDFRNGQRYGRGVYESAKGDRYDGTWVDDMRHGSGTFTFTKVDAKGSKWAGSYEGEWIKDLKHGRGLFSYPNGDKYDGQWVKGKKTGKGVYAYKNGDHYEGEFLADDMHGQGAIFYANGDILVGHWEHDLQHGECIFIVNEDKRVYEQVWDKGERVKNEVSVKKPEEIEIPRVIFPSPVNPLPPGGAVSMDPLKQQQQAQQVPLQEASSDVPPAMGDSLRRPSMPAVPGSTPSASSALSSTPADEVDDLMKEVIQQRQAPSNSVSLAAPPPSSSAVPAPVSPVVAAEKSNDTAQEEEPLNGPKPTAPTDESDEFDTQEVHNDASEDAADKE